MVLPCSPIFGPGSVTSLAGTPGSGIRSVTNGHALVRHAAHFVHRATGRLATFGHHVRHTIATHPGALISNVCRAVPGWMLSGMIAVPLLLGHHQKPEVLGNIPVAADPATQDPGTQDPASNDAFGMLQPFRADDLSGGSDPGATSDPASLGSFNAGGAGGNASPSVIAPAAAPSRAIDPASQVITIMPQVIPEQQSPDVALAPYTAPASEITLVSADPISPQYVPEPSSALVMCGALCGLGAMRRGRPARGDAELGLRPTRLRFRRRFAAPAHSPLAGPRIVPGRAGRRMDAPAHPTEPRTDRNPLRSRRSARPRRDGCAG